MSIGFRWPPGPRSAAVLGLVVFGLGLAGCSEAPVPPRLILVVSIDTLRADALSCYGNPRATTPELDRLAADGVRFVDAFAEAPWTLPSHAALLTSLRPEASAVHNDRGLPLRAPTLAGSLRDRGYRTAAFVASDFVDRPFGFDRGFDSFRRMGRKDAPRSVDAVLQTLRELDQRRVFVFLHLFDVHGPYDARPTTELGEDLPGVEVPTQLGAHDYLLAPFEETPTVPELRRRYEAGVSRVDRELGRLFEELRRRGLYDDSLIVVVSDHGEAFFERETWVGHGLFLYDEELRIPLLLKAPRAWGWAGRIVSGPVALADLLPTVLEIAGGDPPKLAQGTSLIRSIEAGSVPLDRAVVSVSANTGGTRSVRSGHWLYIEPLVDGEERVISQHLMLRGEDREIWRSRIDSGPRLYELTKDPDARHNVVEDHPVVRERLEALLERLRTADRARRKELGDEFQPVDLDPASRERLRALGYLR